LNTPIAERCREFSLKNGFLFFFLSKMGGIWKAWIWAARQAI
jgi:hypothetical protein